MNFNNSMSVRSQQENIYIQRINSVLDFARRNLDKELSLNTLAEVAGFSPFHFHRVFKSLTDETVGDMVIRLRLERAAALLRSAPELSITATAYECGFSSASVFSRAFKKQFGVTARQWDRQSPLRNSKNGQVLEGFPRYTVESLKTFEGHDRFNVRVRTLPAQKLAYIRIFDSYADFSRVQGAYHRLLDWYARNVGDPSRATLYGMSQDDPEITPLRLCRFDWCLSVPDGFEADGEVDLLDFPACDVASVHCFGGLEQEDKALQYLFRYWLPNSRYQPANLPAMEIYRRLPSELGWESYDMDCAIPIVDL